MRFGIKRFETELKGTLTGGKQQKKRTAVLDADETLLLDQREILLFNHFFPPFQSYVAYEQDSHFSNPLPQFFPLLRTSEALLSAQGSSHAKARTTHR
jgi:hypothetical protein